jgi:ligand-binding sensor domain-containing protein/signal transduction histidine kinase
MIAIRKHLLVCQAVVISALALSACQKTVSSGWTAPVTPTVIPPVFPSTYTYPPAKNNGGAIRFVHYGLNEGLSDSSVQVVMQDRLGFLWIGTQDGLDRFDGYSFKVFSPNPDDPHALTDGYISSIFQGSDGMIWVGTHAGLNRYDPKTGYFTHFLHDENVPDSLINDNVQAVYQDKNGNVWVGTPEGLDEFDPRTGSFGHIGMPNNQSQNGTINSVNTLFEDSRGWLWMGTNDGLIRFDLGSRKFQLYQNDSGNIQSISFNEVSSISEDHNGALWVGTYRGLDRLDPSTGQFTRFVHNEADATSLANDEVMSTYIDRAGELWFGTRNGLDRFDPSSRGFIHYQNDPLDPSSLTNNAVDFIYEDRGGVLWIGTIDGGLNKYDRNQDRFTYYHHVNADPDSLSGDIISSILSRPDGRIWIGTYQAGLNLFDPKTGRTQHFRHNPVDPNSLISDSVSALFLDKGGTLWIGTSEGLDHLDPGSSRFIHFVPNTQDPTSIPFGTIYAIFQDRQMSYWIGTSHGVRIFDPATGKFMQFNPEVGNHVRLPNDAVRVIYQDRSGILWFGTSSYWVFRYDQATEELNQYESAPKGNNNISSNEIFDFFQDSHGTLWAATEGGLNRFSPEENGFMQFSKNEGPPDDVVYGILEDRSSNLWLSTNSGLYRFDPSTNSSEKFTVDDGLQSNEFNSSSFAEDAQGRLYFGGVKGLTVFDPADINRNEYIPPVVITSVTTQAGKPIDPGRTAETLQDITLASPENSFDFSFAALSFSQTPRNQYKYFLEGFDKSWNSAGSNHHGSYTNLPGGKYTLHIQGSNSDGAWNNRGAAITITVIPPFWQTWTFRGLAALALIVAALLSYRWRERGIRKQRLELAHIIQERTRALKKRNRDLEALYSADEKMLRLLSLDQVLQALVDVAVDILQADKCAVFTQDQPNVEFTVRVSRGFSQETIDSLRFAEAGDLVIAAAATGAPIAISDTLNDPFWKQQREQIIQRMSAEGIHSLMYIPILMQDTILGVFNVCSSRLGEFDEDRQRLFASLVQRAALSIENNQLFEQTKYLAVLQERNRLARDLHDSAKQKAFAALAQLGTAKRLAPRDDSGVRKYVAEAENIVSEVIRDLTLLVQELYHKDLMEKGLVASIQNYAFEWGSQSGIPLDLTAVGQRELPLETEQVLYRIVHEGLSNIARHSQATRAEIRIVYQEREIEIRISDNGKGFDRQGPAHGLGLWLIHERAEGLGGKVDIQSRSGHGTQLTIRVPFGAKE